MEPIWRVTIEFRKGYTNHYSIYADSEDEAIRMAVDKVHREEGLRSILDLDTIDARKVWVPKEGTSEVDPITSQEMRPGVEYVAMAAIECQGVHNITRYNVSLDSHCPGHVLVDFFYHDGELDIAIQGTRHEINYIIDSGVFWRGEDWEVLEIDDMYE